MNCLKKPFLAKKAIFGQKAISNLAKVFLPKKPFLAKKPLLAKEPFRIWQKYFWPKSHLWPKNHFWHKVFLAEKLQFDPKNFYTGSFELCFLATYHLIMYSRRKEEKLTMMHFEALLSSDDLLAI